MLPHIPYSADGSHTQRCALFNAVVDELTRTNQLQVGPDLHAYFMQHTDQLQADNVHPAPLAGRR